MNTRALAAVLATGAIILATAAPAAAQESGTFVLTQNENEVATEEFTRTGDQLETQLSIAGQGIIATTATLGDEATVSRVELRVLPPGEPDAEPLQSTAAEFGSDSVHVEQPIGSAAAAAAATAGTVPYLNPSPSYMEQILRRARALGGSEVTVQIWVPSQGPGQVVPAQIAFADDGTATLNLGAATIEVETDEDGRLLSAPVPAQGIAIERQ